MLTTTCSNKHQKSQKPHFSLSHQQSVNVLMNAITFYDSSIWMYPDT